MDTSKRATNRCCKSILGGGESERLQEEGSWRKNELGRETSAWKIQQTNKKLGMVSHGYS